MTSDTHAMLAAILRKTETFSDADVELFTQAVRFRAVAKGEVILRQGAIYQTVYYALSGSIYQYAYNDTNFNVIDLRLTNEWFFNHSSFVTQKPSTTWIEAYSEGKILEFTMADVHRLIGVSSGHFRAGKLVYAGWFSHE